MNAFTTQTECPESGPRSTPFDWEALDRALGEDELGPIEYQQLAFALGQILRWVTSGNPGRAGSKQRSRIITARILGLCWATNPEMFNERPSLRALAKTYGIHKSTVSFNASRATKDFDLMNREQIETRKRTKLPKMTKAQLAKN